MTLAELGRAIESKQRIHKRELQEKAQMDYILADAIGRSVSRIYSGKFPSLLELYPTLFADKQEEIARQEEERRAELSAIRFKQFANSFNKRFKGGNVEE